MKGLMVHCRSESVERTILPLKMAILRAIERDLQITYNFHFFVSPSRLFKKMRRQMFRFYTRKLSSPYKHLINMLMFMSSRKYVLSIIVHLSLIDLCVILRILIAVYFASYVGAF